MCCNCLWLRFFHRDQHRGPLYQNNGLYDKCISDGLFSSIKYLGNDKISEFIGEEMNDDEYAIRLAEAKGGCAHFLDEHCYLDCYVVRFELRCKASVADSPNQYCNNVTNSMSGASNAEC